jgi:hypothetical protein
MKYQKFFFCLFFLFPAVSPAQFLFKDVTPSTGILMKSSAESATGPGVVIFDFNNDGWDDIYMAGGESDDKLYLNMHDGTFKDIAPKNLITHAGWRSNPRGGIAFDYDNDGYTDLYLTCQNRDILWHNDGDTGFTDVTRPANLNFPLEKNESISGTFGDFNGDGYNDFYVARWVDESKFTEIYHGSDSTIMYAHKGFPNWFYVNNHDGTFTERAKEFGIDGDTGNTQIALFFDYDRDGDLDLLIGNDFGVELMPNRVYKNMLMETGVATFRDVTDSIGLCSHLFCMGIGPLDYNRDGHFDFFETSIGPDSLMKNNGKDIFHNAIDTDMPPGNGYERSGSGFMTTTWTALAGDFDNDGWEDEVVAHGYEGAIPPWRTNPNKRDTTLFYHNTNGKFHDYTDTSLVDIDLARAYLDFQARGIGAFDFNHDGKLDLCVGSLSIDVINPFSDFRILQNITPPNPERPAHWLEMHFTAKRTAKEAIGTIVDVWVGGKVCSRQVSTGGGFSSQTSLVQHVGLGQYGMADSIIVFWPADKNRHRQIDSYYNVKADTILQFIENTSSPLKSVTSLSHDAMTLYPNPATKYLNMDNLRPDVAKHFEIYDLLGIKQMEFSGSETSLSFSVADLRPGCYVLRISSGRETETKRFIKE